MGEEGGNSSISGTGQAACRHGACGRQVRLTAVEEAVSTDSEPSRSIYIRQTSSAQSSITRHRVSDGSCHCRSALLSIP